MADQGVADQGVADQGVADQGVADQGVADRCAGPQGITVLDAFECWNYQHGLRPMGEIELARGFLGLGAMTA